MEGIVDVGQARDRSGVRAVDVGGALHGERLVGSFGVELVEEGVEACLLLQAVHARRAGCLLLEREVHALVAAVLLGVAGLDALDGDAEPQPPDGKLARVEEGVGGAKGTPLSERMAAGRPRSREQPLEGGEGELFARRFQSLAQQQIARGVIGDGERVAIAPVAELELALEVGAPEIVGRGP